MKPRDEKKVEQIFEATLKLVKEKGVAGITMSEIAKEAGLATGTLYIYFNSKTDLINALFTTCRKASANVYFKNYDAEKPFKIGFKTIWQNLIKYRVENFDQAIFLEQCYHSPYISETTKDITRKLFQPLFKLMERGKEEGLIKNMDTFLLLTYMVGTINEMVKHVHYSGKKLSKPVIENMFNLCWDGLKQ
jgi:TetR/AcrR family transcriptional regulator, repressor of fatR-cypB operon